VVAIPDLVLESWEIEDNASSLKTGNSQVEWSRPRLAIGDRG
jgi:hypothetical protein